MKGDKKTIFSKLKPMRKKVLKAKVENVKVSKSKSASPLEVLLVIVKRGKGELVAKFLSSLEVDLSIISFGNGTADSNLQNLLNLGTKEKEVLFAVVKRSDSTRILDLLDENILSVEKHTGIALTVPLKSITRDAYNKLTVKKEV